MVKYVYPWADERPKGECALALGFFDGVHAAHRNLIITAKAEAEKRGLPLGIFTFNSDSGIKSDIKRLYNDSEKLEMLEKLGADFVVSADFDSIKGLCPEDFVKSCLVSDVGCTLCVAGFNFRFGHKAAGDSDQLVKLMRESGGDAVIEEELKIDGKTVSATEIRGLIESGDVKSAKALLGTPYFIEGTVAHGNSVGHTLGYPTVNIELPEERVRPARGVYRSSVTIDGTAYTALTNIGVCPTFESRSEHAETYILDFSGDLYERRVRVYLLDFLREEKKFTSADELLSQIEKDKIQALRENGE